MRGFERAGGTLLSTGPELEMRSFAPPGEPEGRPYTAFLSTSAEFFDPNAMQLHTACSILFVLPGSGT